MEKVIVTNHNILLMGSFINDFHKNLGIFGTPPCSAQVCPHLDDHPPLALSVWTQDREDSDTGRTHMCVTIRQF